MQIVLDGVWPTLFGKSSRLSVHLCWGTALKIIIVNYPVGHVKAWKWNKTRHYLHTDAILRFCDSSWFIFKSCNPPGLWRRRRWARTYCSGLWQMWPVISQLQDFPSRLSLFEHRLVQRYRAATESIAHTSVKPNILHHFMDFVLMYYFFRGSVYTLWVCCTVQNWRMVPLG